jgi:hypothetical protein
MVENSRGWVQVTRWVARIWSLGPILFALAEIIFPHSEEGVPIHWTDWLALSLAFISVSGLALAWRWERLGGWISVVALAIFLVIFLIFVERSFPAVLIFLVGIGVPAILFLISAYAGRRSI